MRLWCVNNHTINTLIAMMKLGKQNSSEHLIALSPCARHFSFPISPRYMRLKCQCVLGIFDAVRLLQLFEGNKKGWVGGLEYIAVLLLHSPPSSPMRGLRDAEVGSIGRVCQPGNFPSNKLSARHCRVSLLPASYKLPDIAAINNFTLTMMRGRSADVFSHLILMF